MKLIIKQVKGIIVLLDKSTDTFVCKRCGKEKNTSDFYTYKGCILKQPCKECSRQLRREKYRLYGKPSSDPVRSKMLRDRGNCPENHFWCCGCKTYLPRSEFNGRIPERCNGFCKVCQSKWEAARGMKIKKYVIELLGGKCKRCGWIGHYASYDFHHPDPKKKDLVWATIRHWGLPRIKTAVENEQLQLLCANCHIEIHCSLTNDGLPNPEYIKK